MEESAILSMISRKVGGYLQMIWTAIKNRPKVIHIPTEDSIISGLEQNATLFTILLKGILRNNGRDETTINRLYLVIYAGKLKEQIELLPKDSEGLLGQRIKGNGGELHIHEHYFVQLSEFTIRLASDTLRRATIRIETWPGFFVDIPLVLQWSKVQLKTEEE